MAYNYGHPQYLAARAEALARSGGVCQFCGQKPIGLGDWRPEKSGTFGRFETVSIEPIGN